MTHPATRGTRRGLGAALGNALLNVAAAGGVLCVVFVLLAVLFDITLIMFKTGSMSPTIPAGSLAVVREIPATEVNVGDVVTVARQDALPVTHRVTSVAPVDGGLVSITMRGDANPVDDPAPYLASSVRIVLLSVPGLAPVIVWLSNPWVLGTITLGASALVTWAFWPRDESPARRRRSSPRHARAASLAALLVAASSTAVLLPAPAARAAVTEEIVTGSVITLVSVGDRDAMRAMVPEVVVPWQVGVSANPPDPGTVDISLLAAGSLASDPGGLQVTVRLCPVRWVGSSCAAGGSTIAGPGAASSILAAPLAVAGMLSDEQRWVLVEASLPAGPPIAGTAELRLIASGSGDTVVAGGGMGPLATTGVDLGMPVRLSLAAVTVGLGLAMLAYARHRTGWEATP